MHMVAQKIKARRIGMDVIAYNGLIRTMDRNDTVVEAIGIKNGRVAFLGSSSDAAKKDAKERVDLKGQLVLPGFIDTHLHLLDTVVATISAKLSDCSSVDDIVACGREHAGQLGAYRGWLLGWGWDQDRFSEGNGFLTKGDLDRISTVCPIHFSRVCGHIASVNSLGMEMILSMEGIDELRPLIDAENGILHESAVFLYTRLLAETFEGELEKMLKQGQVSLNRKGITGVHTTDFLALGRGEWEKVIHAYQSLEKRNEMTVRIYEQCMFTELQDFMDFLTKGYRTSAGSEFFRIGPLKLFADGSLGARTALMHEPYSDRPETRGIQSLDGEALEAFIQTADVNGMQVAIHGIGDKAIETIADALNAVNQKHSGNPFRHGIVHAQLTNPQILDKMKRGDLLAYIQPVFVPSDMEIVETRIGRERMEKIYAWKTMRDLGIRTSGGSDSPVESFDILENIYTAVTRKSLDGLPDTGWIPEEKLTVEEAVRLFTADAAYFSFEEDQKGSLEIGKLADLVVLDRDIFTILPDEIPLTSVTRTIVGGKTVFQIKG